MIEWGIHIQDIVYNIDSLVQDCGNSIADALKLPQSCPNAMDLIHFISEMV